MSTYRPTLETCLFIGTFFVIYMYLLTKRVVHKKVDLYDFFVLATLGVIPMCFVLFPALVSAVARLIGVEFPFLVLFGGLSAISFFMIYRLIRRTNTLRKDMTILIQRLGIIRAELAHLRSDDTQADE